MKNTNIVSHIYIKSLQLMFLLAMVLGSIGLFSGLASGFLNGTYDWYSGFISSTFMLLMLSIVFPWFFPLFFGEWIYTRPIQADKFNQEMVKRTLMYSTLYLFLFGLYTFLGKYFDHSSFYTIKTEFACAWGLTCLLLIVALKGRLKETLCVTISSLVFLTLYFLGMSSQVLWLTSGGICLMGGYFFLKNDSQKSLIANSHIYLSSYIPFTSKESKNTRLKSTSFIKTLHLTLGNSFKTYTQLLIVVAFLSTLSMLMLGGAQIWTLLLSKGIGNPVSSFFLGASEFDLLFSCALFIAFFHFKFSMRHALEFFQTRPLALKNLYIQNWLFQTAVVMSVLLVAILSYKFNFFYFSELEMSHINIYTLLVLTLFFIIGGEFSWLTFALLGFLSSILPGILISAMILIHTPSVWGFSIWLPVILFRILDYYSFIYRSENFAFKGLNHLISQQGKLYMGSICATLAGLILFVNLHPMAQWKKYSVGTPSLSEVAWGLYTDHYVQERKKKHSTIEENWNFTPYIPEVDSRSRAQLYNWHPQMQSGFKSSNEQAWEAYITHYFEKTYLPDFRGLLFFYQKQKGYGPQELSVFENVHDGLDASYMNFIKTLSQDKIPSAIAQLHTLLEKDPSVQKWRLLALLYSRQFEYPKAASIYRQIILTYPQYEVKAIQSLAQLEQLQGNYKKTFVLYKEMEQASKKNKVINIATFIDHWHFKEMGLCKELQSMASQFDATKKLKVGYEEEIGICHGKDRVIDWPSYSRYRLPKTRVAFKAYFQQRENSGWLDFLITSTSQERRHESLAKEWFIKFPNKESALNLIKFTRNQTVAIRLIKEKGLSKDALPLLKELSHLYDIFRKQGAVIGKEPPVNLKYILLKKLKPNERKDFPILGDKL